MPQSLLFDFYQSIITVPAPDTVLEMQFLIDQIRDTEDELVPAMAYSQIAEAAGKFDLGSGIFTGITVKLLGNWRIKFEDRPGPNVEIMNVTGGNLVGGPSGNPIAPSSYIQVIQQSSAASTISVPNTASDTVNLRYLFAALTDSQKAVGNIYYWDPYSGNDNSTGLTPTLAVATFARAHDLTAAGHHDVIFCLSSHPSGVTEVDEPITITKDTVKVRGPGSVFQIVPTFTNLDSVRIMADSVEISGIAIKTATTGIRSALTVSNSNYSIIKDVWINGARIHGISVTNSRLLKIINCAIESCGASGVGDGIYYNNNTTQSFIKNCIVTQCRNGLHLAGTSIIDNVVENALVYDNAEYGVNIGSNALRTTLRGGSTVINNAGGDFNDLGTNTYIESTGDIPTPAAIANEVWNEALGAHTAPGTTGKTLKDIKTKATLASISK